MKYIIPIISRYGSIAIQFALVALIARHLGADDAGRYFFVAGTVLSLYFLAGFGIPDGLVAACPAENARGNSRAVGALALKGLLYSCALASVVPVSIYVAALSFTGCHRTAIYASIWSAGYCLTFIASQTLVSIDKTEFGSFVFYSAVNVCICFTTIPYLLLSENPSLEGTLASNAFAALAAGASSIVFTLRNVFKLGVDGTAPSVHALWKNGFRISLGRVVQAAIIWMPVWIAGVLLTHSDSAQLGLAGRLLSIVGALLAAVRFSIRPRIAFLAARGEWQAISGISGRIAQIASIFSLCAMAITWTIGQDLIDRAFGRGYESTATLLLILLGASLAESLGGAVDEALKMSGQAGAVLLSQLVSLILMAAAGILLTGRYGAPGAALASTISFAVMYALQIAWLFRVRGIIALPSLPFRNK